MMDTMDTSNKKNVARKLSHEISRLSSENDQLRKMVGLMQENVELRFVLRDHGTHFKTLSPPPPAEQASIQQPTTASLKDGESSSSEDKKSPLKPEYDYRSLHVGSIGIPCHSDNKHRGKQVSMKGYESSGSSSDSLTDVHANEQRKFVYSATKLHGYERGSKESIRSPQVERRVAHYK